jgi:hypothetical protein
MPEDQEKDLKKSLCLENLGFKAPPCRRGSLWIHIKLWKGSLRGIYWRIAITAERAIMV